MRKRSSPQLPPELNTELHTFVGMNDDGDGNYTADELAEKWRTTNTKGSAG